MSIFPQETLQQLISAHGYWAIALIVGLESMGIPLPGETMLVLAAIYAAGDPTMNIWLVIGAAAIGSIIGDNAGYWIGHRYAYAAVLRYGRRVGLSEPRIKVGQYLFRKHGGKVVFFGRFALLRLPGLLANVNHALALAFSSQTGRAQSCGQRCLAWADIILASFSSTYTRSWRVSYLQWRWAYFSVPVT